MPFTGFKLHPSLLRGIKELGFTRPTPIQAEALPPAIEGRDILGCAQTGSGKTAAFLLPILNRLLGKSRGTTRALIITPTRELAAQIQEELQDLLARSGQTVIFVTHSIDEAVLLGDRVVVLSAPPARVCAEFDVPFGRPRRFADLRRDQRFGALTAAVWELLRAEVARRMG